MMIPRKEMKKEEEEQKFPSLVCPKPQYSGFQPYNSGKSGQSSGDSGRGSEKSNASSKNLPKKTRKR